MKNIAFRVDGGPGIGLGHIMRCIALAQAFSNKDFNIQFITRKNNTVEKILNNYGFSYIYIDSDYEYGRDEIDMIKEIINKKSINIFITDSYNIGQQYLLEIKNNVEKLVTIHDYAPFSFPSDIVINGNIYAPDLEYKSYFDDTLFLLGSNYTLLRNEFYDLPEQNIKREVNNLLITFGGTDPLNLTAKVIDTLYFLEKNIGKLENINLNSLTVNFVIGSNFSNKNMILQKIARLNLEICLFFNIKKMSKLMLKTDLAISAGGSTLYELAVTATPTITLLQAENQIMVAEAMEKKGIIKNMGFGNRIDKLSLFNNLVLIIKDYKMRKKMIKKGKKLFNINGAANCVSYIIEKYTGLTKVSGVEYDG